MAYDPQRRFYFKEGIPATTQATQQAQRRAAQERVLFLERLRRRERLRRLLARERLQATERVLQPLLALQRTARRRTRRATLMHGDLLWSGSTKRPTNPLTRGDLLWHARSGGRDVVRPPDIAAPIGKKREAGSGESLLGKIVSILDKPFEWFSTVGYDVSRDLYLKGRSVESKGGLWNELKAFGYYLAAGGEAAVFGVAAGLAGIVSPKAWKSTIDMIRNPKGAWNQLKASISDNPFTINFLAGSFVGAGLGGKAVASRLKGIYEPDMAGLRPSDTVEIVGWLDKGEVKWAARVEKTGPVYPVGKGVSPPRPRPGEYTHIVADAEELIEYSPSKNTRIMLGENEAFEFKMQEIVKGKRVARTWQVKYHDTGKIITAREEWVFKGLLKPRSYRYRGEFYDPQQFAAAVGERRIPEVELWREVHKASRELLEGGWLKPPRLVVEPPAAVIGGVIGGVHGVVGVTAPRRKPLGKPELFDRLREHDRLVDITIQPPRLNTGERRKPAAIPVPISIPIPLAHPLTGPTPSTRAKPRLTRKPIQIQPPRLTFDLPPVRIPKTIPQPKPKTTTPPFHDVPPPLEPAPGRGRLVKAPLGFSGGQRAPRRKGKSRRRKYVEVVYPAPVLPL